MWQTDSSKTAMRKSVRWKAAELVESVFRNSEKIESDGLGSRDIYVDLVGDSVKDIETNLEDNESEAVKKGLSEKGEKKLKESM